MLTFEEAFCTKVLLDFFFEGLALKFCRRERIGNCIIIFDLFFIGSNLTYQGYEKLPIRALYYFSVRLR